MSRVMSQISIQTYLNEVKPNLTAREEMVLEAIETLGEASALTVSQHLNLPINYISGRFTGLKKKDKIIPVGMRDPGTGRMAMFFKPSGVEHEQLDAD